ncbi:PaaI family thioesterase [Schumannella sp. 10F1B-5-1]|nr:PaaI family thioesterase [Schumannella sp. 10F1B-5-1]
MPTLSGLEYLEAMRDGQLPPPPIMGAMLMTLGSVEAGRVEFRCEPDESLYNPLGSVHGGVLCTLLDSATGCAGQSILPVGSGYTSIDIQVSYLRPVRAGDGMLRAIGTVKKPGRRVIFTEAEVLDAEGRAVASATSTLLVLSLDASAAATTAAAG